MGQSGYSVVANIPYYITSNLIRHLLDHLPDRKLAAEPLKLAKLKEKPAVEKLTDPTLWVKQTY